MKVMTILGTRPELVKLSRTIPRFDELFDHRWIHTGQNWSPNLRDVFLEELGVRRPDAQGTVSDASPAVHIAEMLSFVDSQIESWTPDAVLVLGDTNSALTAYAARRRGVPVFHVEAGNRCFDDRTPEELNRRLIDHLSDVNMTYTEHARHHLMREGIRPDRIFVVGSPHREVVEHHLAAIVARGSARRLGLTDGRYLLASLHREENVDDAARRQHLMSSLDRAGAELDCDVILLAHPRTRAVLSAGDIVGRIRMIDSLGMIDFLSLARSARCVVSDSGTLTEEAAILEFPAVTLRRSHERPEGMDVGVLAMAEPHGLTEAIHRVVAARAVVTPRVDAYLPTDVSWRIANIVGSYAAQVLSDHRTTT